MVEFFALILTPCKPAPAASVTLPVILFVWAKRLELNRRREIIEQMNARKK
jgi:hypothetical protein